MRNKNGKIILKRSWEVGTRVTCTVLLVLVLLPMSGCTPDIKKDWKANTDGEMMFNLQANPVSPKSIPQPIYLAINPVTGNVDLSQADIPLPKGLTWKREIPCTELLNGKCTEMQSADCANLTAEQQQILNIASCDVYKYLTSIDGFPTAAPITAQSSYQIDTTTVTATNDGSQTLLVFCSGRTNPFDINLYTTSDFQIDSKPSTSIANAYDLTLTINTAFGINKSCVVAVRGYEKGIKSQGDAKPFIASQTFFLLKEKNSLTCGLTKGDEGLDLCQTNPPALIPTTCQYYPLVAQAPGNEGKSQIYISGLMCVLEYLRTTVFGPVFSGINVLSGSTTMSDEAAIAFAFPTHSKSVIEYIPGKIIPTFDAAANKISIHVNGELTTSQLLRGYMNFSPPASAKGTIYLMNVTSFGFPTYDVVFNSSTKNIEISNINPPLSSNLATTYLIFITKGEDNAGNPIITDMIPFMSTVLGLSTGQLYDPNTNKILVTPLSGITDTTTANISECSRLDLNTLLAFFGPTILTPIGITRESILYVAQTGKPFSQSCPTLYP